MLPLSDGVRPRHFPVVNVALIAANLAVWVLYLGNMLFLAVFGKNVEDAFGHLRYLAFYLAGGLAATGLQTAMTLLFSSDADGRIAMLGASGAIAAVMGAYFVLYPHARIKTILGVFIVQIPAWVYLGGWFLLQLHDANYALLEPTEGGDGVAFFAHVGGFVFGFLVARALRSRGRIEPQTFWQRPPLPL